MSRPIGARPFSGGGAVRKDGTLVCIQGTFTTSTGVFAASGEKLPEYTLGSFTSGIAPLTFPKHLSYLDGFGSHAAADASPANTRSLKVRAVNLAAGTASVYLVLDSDGTTDTSHTIGTGVLRLNLITGD
jgi:hypothetical protein